MANSKKQGFNEDRVEQSNGNDFDDSSSILSAGGTSTAGSGRVSRERSEMSLTERLTDILVDQGDGDLLLQRNDREERVLQWLQALDIQVIGACRADERLKPLLKLNASGSVAEDRLLAHLSQHFEPSEVGMLARCFCIPLVSIRVGKIIKQGTLLCPTAIRGDLNLTLLPTTDLRLSFIGDDGNTERLFTLSGKTQCAAVEVDEIPADSSGRSFNLKISDGRVFYFWCSEKSKLLGIELVAKMKDILKSKPSIADLSGISKSRLDCFATHLRAYLSNGQEISAYSPASSSTTPETYDSTSTTKSLRTRHFGNQAVKTNSAYQGSLSPRSSSFKDGLSRSLSSLRNVSREKLRRCVDSHLSAVDKMMGALPLSHDGSRNQSGNEKLQEAKSCPVPSSVLESPGRLSLPPFQLHASHVMSSPPLSPYYCWCPQGASTLQSSTPLEIPTSSAESSLLPPLPPLLSASRPSNLLSPIPTLSLADFPSLDFPVLLPDPLVRFPISSSQQIPTFTPLMCDPTFTPLMCDPIVHIPVIDVCSSGQGYLVSAGPTIPPLHPKLVNPLIPNTADSLLEKGARETLRLLMSSTSQTNPQFMDFLPSVLTNSDQKRMLATGSWSLYSGTRGVDAIANRIATMGLVSLSEYSIGDSVAEMSGSCDNTNNLPDNLPDESSAVDGPCSDDDCTFFSNAGEGTTN